MNDYSLEVAIWSSRIYRMRMKTFLDPSLTYQHQGMQLHTSHLNSSVTFPHCPTYLG